jgi:hypothetical protein
MAQVIRRRREGDFGRQSESELSRTGRLVGEDQTPDLHPGDRREENGHPRA